MKRKTPQPPSDWPTDRIFLENEAEELEISDDPFADAPAPPDNPRPHAPVKNDTNEDMEITLINKRVSDFDVTVKNVKIESGAEVPAPAILPSSLPHKPEPSREWIPPPSVPIIDPEFVSLIARKLRTWTARLRSKKRFGLGALGLIALAVLFGLLFTHLPSTQKKSLPIPTRAAPLKFTTVEILNPAQTSQVANLEAGEKWEARFFVDAWENETSRLSFRTGLRIYSERGKLLVYEPDFAAYTGTVDAKRERIEVRASVQTATDLAPGTYRLQWDVVETTTGAKARVQAKIKVIESFHPKMKT